MSNLFAIADLHLPGGQDKAMDLFGKQWIEHVNKIEINWQKKINKDDLVLIPGDISWAMKLDEAEEDLARIGSWPGTKIMIKGNHDYWWQGIGKVRKALSKDLFALQNDSFLISNWQICGTRGWKVPGNKDFNSEDEKIYLRELERLELSLKSRQNEKKETQTVVMLHYPPFNEKGEASGFVDVMKNYGVEICVYGHLHGDLDFPPQEGLIDGINYYLVACDYLDFSPLMIKESK